MKIVLDSDFLIALVKQDDSSHNLALDLVKRVANQELLLATTTLAEAVSTLGRKTSLKLSYKLLDYISETGFDPKTVDNAMVVFAEKFYRQQKSNKNTFFDCLNMALARAYEADFILSFDRGYEKNGFKLLK